MTPKHAAAIYDIISAFAAAMNEQKYQCQAQNSVAEGDI
jgi:hypothetical protein